MESQHSRLSDDEFLNELRRHLPDRSWSLAQWVELERRGFDLLENDAELQSAIEQEYAKLSESSKKILEPIQRGVAERLEPLQRHFREIAQSIAPKVNFSRAFPRIDMPAMMSPVYSPQVGADPLRYSLREIGGRRPLADSKIVRNDEVLTALASVEKGRLEREAEARRAQLETATAAVSQLKVMEDLREIVARSAKRDWYDWLLILLTAVAAVGAVVGSAIAIR